MSVSLVMQTFSTFLNGENYFFATRIAYGVQLTINAMDY